LFDLLSRFIGFRALLLGMFTTTLLFTIGYFASTPDAFSLPKFNMFNPARTLIGNSRISRGSAKEMQTWKVLHSAAFVSADPDGKITVTFQEHRFGLRLYYLGGFNSAVVPYLTGLLKNVPLTIVTRWEVSRGAFGAFITVPSLQRDLAALLVEQSLATIGGVQPSPPASTRERYLGHLTSLSPP
jgi:hypothetical protein